MLEEDPAEITVHLVQFEKYVPFCMPGAEGTNAFVVTWLRTGGRTVLAGVLAWMLILFFLAVHGNTSVAFNWPMLPWLRLRRPRLACFDG